MKLRLQIAAFAVLAFAGLQTAEAKVSFSADLQDTPELPGFTTFTLTATSDEGPFFGFDFSSNGGGFFGPLNQVNPLDQPTIFRNNNAFIELVGENPLQDSQFLITTRAGTDENLATGVLGESESSMSLKAAVLEAEAFNFGSIFPFAQIVIENGNVVNFQGTMAFEGGREVPISGRLSTVAVPEPSTLALLAAAGGGLSLRRRRK